MSRPPVVVEWINGDEGTPFFFGMLVVKHSSTSETAGLTIGAIGILNATLNGPVGVVNGVPATGALTGQRFSAIIEGEAIVRVEPGLTILPGQRLYISPNISGVATNNEQSPAPVYTVPIGIVKSLQSDPEYVLAAIGEVADASDRQMWTTPPFRGAAKGVTPIYRAMGPTPGNPGAPRLATCLANSGYGTSTPYVLGVNQSGIGTLTPGNVVFGGMTMLALEPGLDLQDGQELFLSDTSAGLGTNVAPSTPGNYIVPLGPLINSADYVASQRALILLRSSPPAFLIP